MARRVIKTALEKSFDFSSLQQARIFPKDVAEQGAHLHLDRLNVTARGLAEAPQMQHRQGGGCYEIARHTEDFTGFTPDGHRDMHSRNFWLQPMGVATSLLAPTSTVAASGEAVGSRMASGWQLSLPREVHQWRNLSIVPHTNGKRKFMIDTLALVRKLEAQGLSPQQAEGITALITQIMNESMEDVSSNFVSRQDMQMTEMMAETTLSKFKNEMKSTQEQNYDSLRRETERLRSEIEKMRSELRYEMDKVTAGQRLDMNLEKGRMREELQKQSQETGNLNNKLDREINSLKAEMEAAKFEVIKYCVGTLVSVSAVGLGLLRILM